MTSQETFIHRSFRLAKFFLFFVFCFVLMFMNHIFAVSTNVLATATIVPSGVVIDFHVAIDGDDNNIGTLNFPFKNLQKAFDSLNVSHFNNGDFFIHMHEGVHTSNALLPSSLGFPASDRRLVITSFQNENAVISTLVGGFGLGIESDFVVVSNLAFSNGQGDAIKLFGADNIVLSDIQVSKYFNGIYIDDQSTNVFLIDSKIFLNNKSGLYIGDFADHNRIERNEFFENSQAEGILINGGNENIIFDNRIFKNKLGISLLNDSDQNQILSNSIFSNQNIGIKLSDNGPNNDVDQNLVAFNEINGPDQKVGIEIGKGSQNSIRLNRIANHDTDGLRFFSDANNNSAELNNIFMQNENIKDTSTGANQLSSNYFGSIHLATIQNTLSSVNDDQFVPYRLGEIGIHQSDVLPPAIPNFVFAVNIQNGVLLKWNDVGQDVSGYHLYRAVADDWGGFTTYLTNLGNVTSFTDQSADTNLSYYYFITSVDGATPFENESWFSTSISNIPLPPLPQFTENQIVFVDHDPRVIYTPGTKVKVKYLTNDQTSGFEFSMFVTNLQNNQEYPLGQNGEGHYEGEYAVESGNKKRDAQFTLKVKDSFNRENRFTSIKSVDIDDVVFQNESGDRIVLSRDNRQTKALILKNSLSEDIRLSIRKRSDLQDAIAYDFEAVSAATGSKVDTFNRINKVFIHFEINNDAVIEELGVGLADQLKLLVYRYNGVEWVLVGNDLNESKQLVGADVDYFTTFAIRLEDGEDFKMGPSPFTPNADGINDFIAFTVIAEEVESPQMKIYSLTGSLVADLDVEYNSSTKVYEGRWDGKRDGGKVNKDGIYVYQIKIGEKRINGVCILSR